MPEGSNVSESLLVARRMAAVPPVPSMNMKYWVFGDSAQPAPEQEKFLLPAARVEGSVARIVPGCPLEFRARRVTVAKEASYRTKVFSVALFHGVAADPLPVVNSCALDSPIWMRNVLFDFDWFRLPAVEKATAPISFASVQALSEYALKVYQVPAVRPVWLWVVLLIAEEQILVDGEVSFTYRLPLWLPIVSTTLGVPMSPAPVVRVMGRMTGDSRQSQEAPRPFRARAW